MGKNVMEIIDHGDQVISIYIEKRGLMTWGGT